MEENSEIIRIYLPLVNEKSKAQWFFQDHKELVQNQEIELRFSSTQISALSMSHNILVSLTKLSHSRVSRFSWFIPHSFQFLGSIKMLFCPVIIPFLMESSQR